MEYQLKVLDVENRNLVKQLSDQRNINEALMMAPQNINFLALKKNYEL